MGKSRHRSSFRKINSRKSAVLELWEEFWDAPRASCPKCKSTRVEYYDPFFFSFWRTLTGRRRYRCRLCHFVWRKSRTLSPIRRAGFFS